jgi:hypothetical protein
MRTVLPESTSSARRCRRASATARSSPRTPVRTNQDHERPDQPMAEDLEDGDGSDRLQVDREDSPGPQAASPWASPARRSPRGSRATSVEEGATPNRLAGHGRTALRRTLAVPQLSRDALRGGARGRDTSASRCACRSPSPARRRGSRGQTRQRHWPSKAGSRQTGSRQPQASQSRLKTVPFLLTTHARPSGPTEILTPAPSTRCQPSPDR